METGGVPMCDSRVAERRHLRLEDLVGSGRRSVAGSDGTNGCASTVAQQRRLARRRVPGRTTTRRNGRSPGRRRGSRRGSCSSAGGRAARRSRSRSATSRCSPRRNRSRLGEQRAVLGDEAVAAEDEVGGRFADAARGVDVAGDAAARLRRDELPAVAGLADHLVAGRQVGEHGRPGERLRANSAAPASTGPRRSRRRATKPGTLRQSNSRSVPNGTLCPATRDGR